jgi:hypothetical protein
MGENRLNASTAGVVRATFTGTGTPGQPTALVKVAGDQIGTQGLLVTVPPSVRVRDANDNPVAGVEVTFTITAGGGTLTGSTVTTGTNGIATLGGWRLGNVRLNTVTASAAGLAETSFVVAGRGCIPIGTIVAAQERTGTLTTTDCNDNGHYTDWWTFTTPTQAAVAFSERSPTGFDSFLGLFAAHLLPVATNDDVHPTTDNAGFMIILAPGTYNLAPSTLLQNVTGSYVIAASLTQENQPGCNVIMFVMPGIRTSQAITDLDCLTSGTQQFPFDRFAMVLHAGRPYTITMTSTAFDTWLELYNVATGTLVAVSNDASELGTNSSVSVTPAAEGLYLIAPSTAFVGASGAYTLEIEGPITGAGRPVSGGLEPLLRLPHGRGLSMPIIRRNR